MKLLLHLITSVLLLDLCCWQPARGVAQNQLDELLVRLSRGPIDQADLWSLEAQPNDPRTIPALKTAFERRSQKRERQWIAATLLSLGERSEQYYNYLAKYAEEAIGDRTPIFSTTRGKFSPEFLNWCAQNGKDPKTIAGLQLSIYPVDVLILARVRDRRADELFRRGLDSTNGLIVAYCVQGLGRIEDTAALPLIAKAVERLPTGAESVIAGQLPWFATVDAVRLMERLVPDRKLRDFMLASVQRQQLAELSRVERREGKLPHTHK